jgi:hypothetical protein
MVLPTLATLMYLSLFLHPLLVVELDIFLVFPSRAVCLAHGRRVVGQVRVAVVAEVLRHDDDDSSILELNYIRSSPRAAEHDCR